MTTSELENWVRYPDMMADATYDEYVKNFKNVVAGLDYSPEALTGKQYRRSVEAASQYMIGDFATRDDFLEYLRAGHVGVSDAITSCCNPGDNPMKTEAYTDVRNVGVIGIDELAPFQTSFMFVNSRVFDRPLLEIAFYYAHEMWHVYNPYALFGQSMEDNHWGDAWACRAVQYQMRRCR
jgi:hypothetical protein